MKYRKKPVEVEAFRLGIDPTPEWFVYIYRNCNKIILKRDKEGRTCVDIVTPEWVMKANYADYIILGVQGEIYPCKPQIFEMTYERAEEE